MKRKTCQENLARQGETRLTAADLCGGHPSLSLCSHTGVSLLILNQTWEDGQYPLGWRVTSLLFVIYPIQAERSRDLVRTDSSLSFGLCLMLWLFPRSSQFLLLPPAHWFSSHLIIWEVERNGHPLLLLLFLFFLPWATAVASQGKIAPPLPSSPQFIWIKCIWTYVDMSLCEPKAQEGSWP